MDKGRSGNFGDVSLKKDRGRDSHFEWLEWIYAAYNRKEFIHPDPLEFVTGFADPADQEVSGLIAATLAFGRVGHILRNLEGIFGILEKPAAQVASMSRRELKRRFQSFRHRWVTGEDLSNLLTGVKALRAAHGSLESCFTAGLGGGDANVVPALVRFVSSLKEASGVTRSSLLSCPTDGSACKRLFLYLRWMVRKDAVDPGPWKRISPSLLVVPMDTHVHRIATAMGWTSRRQADLKSALEVTSFFKGILPGDPVRYDFSLTRPGIWGMGKRRVGLER